MIDNEKIKTEINNVENNLVKMFFTENKGELILNFTSARKKLDDIFRENKKRIDEEREKLENESI